MKKKNQTKEEKKPFNFKSFEQEALKGLKEGKPLEGKEGILAPLIKRLVEASLEGELDAHLEQEETANRRNGKMSKGVKTGFGKVEINTPRDRNSSFDPQTLPKRQTVLGDALDHKVISMYSRGMSYSDMCDHLEELYGLTVSPAALTTITNRVIEDVKQWQNRPLESVYTIVWLDAMHVKVRHEGAICTRAVYCIIGLNREGIKELLGLYIGEHEGARFWLQVLTELQNRGVKDILIACIDNLKGFAEAIQSIFPETDIQLCIVHQIRNSTKYVTSKEIKAVMEDLKAIYKAPNMELAEIALAELERKWNDKYPYMVKSWKSNWLLLSSYFHYPKEIRRMMYTTNVIESFHSQLRKVIKTKRVFSSDQSVMKLIYLIYQNMKKGWSGPVHGWKLIYAQMMIIFEERMKQN